MDTLEKNKKNYFILGWEMGRKGHHIPETGDMMLVSHHLGAISLALNP